MILVVDDDERIRGMLRELLEREGFAVKTAANGGEAFDLLRGDEVCQCVLLDMRMPDINGAQLLLLMQTEGIEVPVFVFTGFDDFEADELAGFANVAGFFRKPMDTTALIEGIRNAVAGS